MARKPPYEELEQRVKELEKVSVERKRAEEALQRITEEQSVLLSTVPAMIFWIDREGTFVRVNDSFAAALHTSPDDIKGKSLFDQYPEDMARKYYDDNIKVMESGAPKRGIEECVETPTGTMWVSTEKIPYKDEKGNIIGIVGFSQDITVRKQAEDALRENEEKYRTLVEGLEDVIVSFSLDGTILYCSPNVNNFGGYDSKEEIGHHFSKYIADEEVKQELQEFFQGIIKRKKTITFEFRYKPKSKDPFYVEAKASPIINEKTDEIVSIQCIVRDITERKQAEEQLRRSNEELLREHNQRKILSKRLIDLLEKDRRQIAMELHDQIGQTLTSLKMNLEMIHGKLKPGHTDLGARITAAQEKTIQAIKDVKNVSHGLRPAMIDALGVVSSLRELCNEVQQQTDIEIHFFSRGIPKRFEEGKELATYRIVQEALGNIIRHAQAKNVFVNLVKKDEKLLLSVEDDGVGFDQDRVMKPSKKKGPLGLLIMRERAVQLDGEFTLESQHGKGTHLLAEIPI